MPLHDYGIEQAVIASEDLLPKEHFVEQLHARGFVTAKPFSQCDVGGHNIAQLNFANALIYSRLGIQSLYTQLNDLRSRMSHGRNFNLNAATDLTKELGVELRLIANQFHRINDERARLAAYERTNKMHEALRDVDSRLAQQVRQYYSLFVPGHRIDRHHRNVVGSYTQYSKLYNMRWSQLTQDSIDNITDIRSNDGNVRFCPFVKLDKAVVENGCEQQLNWLNMHLINHIHSDTAVDTLVEDIEKLTMSRAIADTSILAVPLHEIATYCCFDLLTTDIVVKMRGIVSKLETVCNAMFVTADAVTQGGTSNTSHVSSPFPFPTQSPDYLVNLTTLETSIPNEFVNTEVVD